MFSRRYVPKLYRELMKLKIIRSLSLQTYTQFRNIPFCSQISQKLISNNFKPYLSQWKKYS
jgi:hypothetical protein